MFKIGEIWGYPTDTSFGLGVRADDEDGLERLALLKRDRSKKYFSLMCADEKMLRDFANVPKDFNVHNFFFEKPRTILLEPTDKLPKSRFYPAEKVAFRISTIPDIARQIEFPVTVTSANLSGENPIFEVLILQKTFGDKIKIYDKISVLEKKSSSEMWDFTENQPKQIR